MAADKKGVCERGRELIRQQKTNQQVLAVLKKEFRSSKIAMGGVNWLRNDLRQKGEKKVKTNRELTAAVAKPAKKKAA